jgi:hypothetical protein
MSEFTLPDVELTLCAVELPRTGNLCGAQVRLVDVSLQPELQLTIMCVFGHQVSGRVSDLFRPEDLARAAVLAIELSEFRELSRIVDRYQIYVASTAAAGEPLDTRSHDLELGEWAAGLSDNDMVSLDVWKYVREHWGTVEKPDYPDPTLFTSRLRIPDEFILSDWV